MPKKTQGRAAKGRTRARRPQQRPVQPATGPVAAPESTAAIPAQQVPVAPGVTQRRGLPRRPVGLTINYAYLRRDLRTLAVLAPLMVVLLVFAYFLFHTA